MSIISRLDLISSELFNGASFSSLTKFNQLLVLQIYDIDNITD
jgi:hypothetical protein